MQRTKRGHSVCAMIFGSKTVGILLMVFLFAF